MLAGVYTNANNYICIRYDTAVDANLRFVTRAAAAETTTVLGAADNNWHQAYLTAGSTECRLILDGGTTVSHNTNIPAGNLCLYAYLETLAGAAKNIDLRHLRILQDYP